MQPARLYEQIVVCERDERRIDFCQRQIARGVWWQIVIHTQVFKAVLRANRGQLARDGLGRIGVNVEEIVRRRCICRDVLQRIDSAAETLSWRNTNGHRGSILIHEFRHPPE